MKSEDAGVDALRVGMGISSVSTAHKDRGCGRAQASAVYNVATRLRWLSDYPSQDSNDWSKIGPILVNQKGLRGLWAMSKCSNKWVSWHGKPPKSHAADQFSMKNMFPDMVA